MKVTDQYFPPAIMFIMLYNVVLDFEPTDKILWLAINLPRLTVQYVPSEGTESSGLPRCKNLKM